MAGHGSPVLIDGSQGEGGGALVRTCLAMSCLTQQPVRIDNVRGGTKFPGLDYEDLVLVRAFGRSCTAETTGAEIGSNALSFLPTRRPKGLKGNLDLPEGDGEGRTASAPVVLNALLPVLTQTGMYSQVNVSGETHGNHSLSFDYFQNVTIPALQKLGLYAFPDLELAGFGRESRGRLTMDIEPSALQPLDWSSRGKLIGCQALVTTAELQPAVFQRAASHLRRLADHAKVPIEIESNPVDSHASGAFVTVWAVCERGMGGSAIMGRRGLRVENLVQKAFEEVLDWLSGDATVDPFLADQLLVAACMAPGESTFKPSRLTQRLLTSIWVIKQFLPIHITVRGVEDKPGVVSIKK